MNKYILRFKNEAVFVGNLMLANDTSLVCNMNNAKQFNTSVEAETFMFNSTISDKLEVCKIEIAMHIVSTASEETNEEGV